MLGFRTYKQLPAGLMQAEQEITSAGQESHSKVCHPMAESSPAIQLRPSEKDASSKQALALYSTLGYCCCCPPPTPVARKPGGFILSPGQREKDSMVMAAEHYYCSVFTGDFSSHLACQERYMLPLYRQLCLATTLICFLA